MPTKKQITDKFDKIIKLYDNLDEGNTKIICDRILATIKYPYMKYYVKPSYIKRAFKLLKKENPTILADKYTDKDLTSLVFNKKYNGMYNGKYTIFLCKNKDNDIIEQISDYFTERCRIKCLMSDNIGTQITYFRKHLNDIIKDMIKWDNNLSIETLRTSTRILGTKNGYTWCSYFNPVVMTYFINLFKAKRILDMSSGWGDRLIGAMACDIECYHGFDPNHCLHSGYNKIIKFFSKIKKNKESTYIIKEQKFEDAVLEDNYYDLLMSSPPFFDIEIYDKKSTYQSINVYKTEDIWYTNFLMVSIAKINRALKKSGICALHIVQKKHQTFVSRLIDDMEKNKAWKYIGTIGFKQSTKNDYINPVFIWMKISNI